MIIVHVVYKMKKEERPGFIADLVEKKIQELTEAEPGNLLYRFAVPMDCEDELVLTEEWESPEALATHAKGANIALLGELKNAHGVVSYVNKFVSEPM